MNDILRCKHMFGFSASVTQSIDAICMCRPLVHGIVSDALTKTVTGIIRASFTKGLQNVFLVQV